MDIVALSRQMDFEFAPKNARSRPVSPEFRQATNVVRQLKARTSGRLLGRHQELEERSWLEVLCLVTGDVGVTIQLQLPGPGTFAEV